jgi:hypothetical protein
MFVGLHSSQRWLLAVLLVASAALLAAATTPALSAAPLSCYGWADPPPPAGAGNAATEPPTPDTNATAAPVTPVAPANAAPTPAPSAAPDTPPGAPPAGAAPAPSTGAATAPSADATPAPSAGAAPAPSTGAAPAPSTGAAPAPSAGAAPAPSAGAAPAPSAGATPAPAADATPAPSDAAPAPAASNGPATPAAPTAATGAAPGAAGSTGPTGSAGPTGTPPGGGGGGAGDDDTTESESDRTIDRLLPQLVLLVPEDALDLKVSRLINKVLFEGEVRYAFVSGDITAFLRYRYYGPTRTTQVEVFDQINFGHLGLGTTFQRTRGLLAFEEWPHDYSFRTFALEEVDRISSNQEAFLSTNNLTNTFIRLGGQIGSPGDNRTQAIVGDTRAYVPNIFTAVREIGPNQFSLTSGLSYGFPLGNFNYVKLESEALKRFDLTDKIFLVGRLHQGSFLIDHVVNKEALDPEDRFSIPINEFFTVGGPDNLKGISSNLIGSQELHNTWELFFPWFLDQHHRVLDTDWQSWYWILYSGWGTLGDDTHTYTDLSNYIVDSGVGFEAAVRLWRYRFFVSGIVARALKGSDHVEARLSVRSYR